MAWVVQQWLSLPWRDWEPHTCSVHQNECLRDSNLALKTGGFLESHCLSQHWKARKAGLQGHWRMMAETVMSKMDSTTKGEGRQMRSSSFSIGPPNNWTETGRCHDVPSESSQTHPKACLLVDLIKLTAKIKHHNTVHHHCPQSL